MSVAATGPPTPVVLHDGTEVELAAMLPTDADRLLRFHHTLSSDTTYMRYFSFHPELSGAELHRFTHVDHQDREAFVAIVAGEIAAVARFDRIANGTDAEVAFVVADAWQRRGLGPLLLDRLVERARRVGIERFIASTLAHNRHMLSLFDHCGLPLTKRTDGGIVDVEIDLRIG